MEIKESFFYNWNLTCGKKASIFKPKNYRELKSFFNKILKDDKFFIRTGECSYGDKSLSSLTNNCLSLENFNKILSFDKKKKL